MTATILLRTGLLLIFCAHFGSPAFVVAKREAAKTRNQQIVDELNDYRKRFATDFNIANMNELVYDLALECKARALANCNIKDGLDYIFFAADDIRSAITVRASLNPLQTKVGCAKLPTDCKNIMLTKKGFCLIGPYSSYFKSDVVKGPIGSRCTNGVAESKLCKVEIPDNAEMEENELCRRSMQSSGTINSYLIIFPIVWMFVNIF